MTARQRIQLLAVFTAIALCADARPVVAQQNLTVRGRVVEAGTGNRIAGVTVELVGTARTLTGSNGEFRFLILRSDTTLVITLGIS